MTGTIPPLSRYQDKALVLVNPEDDRGEQSVYFYRLLKFM